MSGALKRATITPYDAGGENPLSDQTIKFDFNPETLTLKVSTGQQQDKPRQGRQQVQSTGSSQATLSFEAIFDTTRPKSHDHVEAGALNTDTALDVRKRTKPIADLLQSVAGKDAKASKAPARVRFQWGSILFNGVITSHQETFDFFSPSGVPLRSKVALTLTEHEFKYAIEPSDLARAAAAAPPADARAAATAANANSLFDLGPGGLALGFSAGASLDLSLSASVSLSAQLGISADIGVSLDAGINLSASAAIDVFGGAALSMSLGGSVSGSVGISGGASAGLSGGGLSGGGGADVGQAGLAGLAPSPALPAGARPPPSPWAPDGPAPGSAAAQDAAAVVGMRAAGLAVPPSRGPSAQPGRSASPADGSVSGGGSNGATSGAGLVPPAPTPAAIRGSPPLVLPRTPMFADTVYAADRMVPRATMSAGPLPRWQALPGGLAAWSGAAPGAASIGVPVRYRHAGGCGCRSCRGH